MSTIYHRDTGTIEQTAEYRAGTLHFLYHTAIGRILLNLIVARPWFSRLRGVYQKSRFSQKDIEPFAKKHGISVEDPERFPSFNDFFIRKKEIVARDFDAQEFLAIADGKMRYYPITSNLKLTIKNSVYDLEDILADHDLAHRYENGTCIVFRLTVDDYHRYHYIDNGQLRSHKHIQGKLHTVRPVSEKYKVYAHNTREVSLLDTEHMGEVVQIEIGALLVGRIVNHPKTTFCKMEEKGYFEFGGSTIVLLVNKPVRFDDDIVRMNTAEIETAVRAGERIGIIC